MFYLISALYLGWSLGANDAANIFGTAVSSKMVRFITAAILASIFVILGAILEGRAGIETIGRLSVMDLGAAGISSIAAAIAVTIMTILKLPVSTSQAVVGSIVGVGIMQRQVTLTGLDKIIVCWIGTPIGGCLFSMILYVILARIINRLKPSLIGLDLIMRAGLIIKPRAQESIKVFFVKGVLSYPLLKDPRIKKTFFRNNCVPPVSTQP